MGVLATWKDALRTALAAAPASLTPLPQGQQIDKIPDTDKIVFAVKSRPTARIGAEHGGGVQNLYEGATLIVQLASFCDVDEEEFNDTMSDAEQNVTTTVQKVSNYSGGVILATRAGGDERIDGRLFRWDLYFDVTYRVTEDTT